MATGHSLKLNNEWDLFVDEAGNIATCTEDEAIAQDVCNAIRLFTDDAWFYPERGIDHFNLDLGVKPLISQVRARFTQAAQSVDGVAAATITNLQVDDNRQLHGQELVVTVNGGLKGVDIRSSYRPPRRAS